MIRTQVAIVGAGPAGMILAHLLRRAGIDCLVLERRDRTYVEGRVRAGVLESGTVALLETLGLGGRLRREGLRHTGTVLSFDGAACRFDFEELVGSAVTVYGQQEVMHDLYEAAAAEGLRVIFEADEVTLHDVGSDKPRVSWTDGAGAHEVACDFIAGCDGFHGVCRATVPAAAMRSFERVYPFGWLGILTDEAPCHHELIYASHENGFALASMRSPTRSRYYLQCDGSDRLEDWSDERFWEELCRRLGEEVAAKVTRGPSFEKAIAPLRSWVAEPMRFGRLFLAGDAAHIVPPTGAKGMNLAVSDVTMMAEGFAAFYRDRSMAGLDGYSKRALARVWKAERFSWWFTCMTHRFGPSDGFERRMQAADFAYLTGSRAAQISFAENYVGLPLDEAGSPLA